MLLLWLLTIETAAGFYSDCGPYGYEDSDQWLCRSWVSGLPNDTCIKNIEPCGTTCYEDYECDYCYDNYGISHYKGHWRILCKETNKCHDEDSDENIACRNRVGNNYLAAAEKSKPLFLLGK